MTGSTRPIPRSPAARRWLARAALLAAVAAAVVLLVGAGVRGALGLLVVGAGGLAVALVGAWWFLAHRGPVRWAGAVLAVVAPVAVLVVYGRNDLLWVVAVTAVLLAVAAAAGAAALVEPRPEANPEGPAGRDVPPPRRPVLIMNPRSGGGKVVRFGLVEAARELGAEVVVLDGPGMDVVEIARAAVRTGADLLGVAGGDGTQALVAAVAAEHDLPFLVVSAGTRNHFALDLGLDREDPSRCLDALEDGVELRIDLGDINGRPFVNNASFGAYAVVVQSPAYRDAKARTTLDVLPDALAPNATTALTVRVGDTSITGPQAVLVSNNPYARADLASPGRRPRLDSGLLGVLALRIEGAVDAAALLGGLRSRPVWRGTTTEVVVEADTPTLPVGVDGEALLLPTPVRCTIRPGALRVRVPRQRPGAQAAPRAWDRRSLWSLAVGGSADGT
jgi:diacylglycerol kinase family enzyme